MKSLHTVLTVINILHHHGPQEHPRVCLFVCGIEFVGVVLTLTVASIK